MSDTASTVEHAPLLSPRFVWKLTAVVTVLCLITLAIAVSGRMIGKKISYAGARCSTLAHIETIGFHV